MSEPSFTDLHMRVHDVIDEKIKDGTFGPNPAMLRAAVEEDTMKHVRQGGLSAAMIYLHKAIVSITAATRAPYIGVATPEEVAVKEEWDRARPFRPYAASLLAVAPDPSLTEAVVGLQDDVARRLRQREAGLTPSQTLRVDFRRRST